MYSILLPLLALLSGVALLLMGSGLLGTLLALRGGAAGFGDQTLGLIMSCYFVGFLLGTFLGPAAIRRMGHIRAFTFYAALCACTVLAHPLIIEAWAWAGLRVVTGVALVGMYTVIESWLGASVDGSQRGRVFSIYMVVNLLALATGQQLLRLAPIDSFALFSVAAMLMCLAMMPVAATRLGQPVMQSYRRISPRELFRVAPAAAGGALFSGLTMGAFWGMGPVYAGRMGLSPEQVASFMSLTILGGALLQWPIGWLSDRGDRRNTLGIVCAVAAAVAAFVAIPETPSVGLLYISFFVFGGLAFVIYPVAIAHLLDHVSGDDVLAACSTILLVNGLGAVLGPALSGMLMEWLGARALPGFLSLTNAILAAYIGYRVMVSTRGATRPEAHFHPMLRTTPTAMEMLPESESGRAVL